jgi:N-acyl-D-amino-acid deacylase
LISTVLENAAIIDGTGLSSYTTDLGIVDERIALIGDLRDREAVQRIDCTGKTLAPGFIDVHSHSDALWLELPRCDGKIAQGVTTEIAGNCGTSVDPRMLDRFLRDVEHNGIALNVATLVGLGTTRKLIAGDSERRLEREEIEAQARIVRDACEQGAIGISSGLIYPPSMYADTGELAAMAQAARIANAPRYVSHLRSEGDDLIPAVEEAIEIGRRADVLVQFSHHKASGKKNWGKVHQSLELIDAARTRGIDAYCDVYPYIASWTELATILPEEARYGGVDATLDRLSDPELAAAIQLQLHLRYRDQWRDMLVTDVASEKNSQFAGMRIDEIAKTWRLSAAAAALRLLREEKLDVGAVFFKMCEDDVATVLSADFCCIGSDASIRALSGPTARGVPHPRTFGTFPRVFGRYVRGRRTLELVDAIRRMTALPAAIFGLRDRGTIEVGKYADLVVFDSETVRDTATYEAPYQFPIGISHVFVNGRAVIRDGEFTSERPGRALRSNGL